MKFMEKNKKITKFIKKTQKTYKKVKDFINIDNFLETYLKNKITIFEINKLFDSTNVDIYSLRDILSLELRRKYE